MMEASEENCQNKVNKGNRVDGHGTAFLFG